MTLVAKIYSRRSDEKLIEIAAFAIVGGHTPKSELIAELKMRNLKAETVSKVVSVCEQITNDVNDIVCAMEITSGYFE